MCLTQLKHYTVTLLLGTTPGYNLNTNLVANRGYEIGV